MLNKCRDAISAKGAARGSPLAATLTHGEKFIAHIAFQLQARKTTGVLSSELARIAVDLTVRAYERRKLSNPAYDFRNVKLLEDMAAEILKK